MTEEPIDVVVLASGVNSISLFEGYVPGYKALLPFGGKASIQIVLDALCALPEIGRICIEGPRAEIEAELATRRPDPRIAVVDGGATFLDSLTIGLRHFRHSRRVLFAAADLPLLTPDAVRAFLCATTTAAGSTGPGAFPQAIHVSVVPRERFTGKIARFTKPFNRFRDIAVCHGNLFLLDPDLLDNTILRDKVTKMYAGRKNLFSRIAFGWKIALTFLVGVDLLHCVTLRGMAAVTSDALGVAIVPVPVDYPEIALDVDEARDYRLVQEVLAERAESRHP